MILIHIPRTAGQTLNGIVGRNYAPSEVLTYPGSVGDELSTAGIDTQALRVVRGHVTYGIHTELDVPYEYATFLRRPLSRVVSLHRYIVQNPKHPLHDTVKAMPLEEFVVCGVDGTEVENGQTRQLFGRSDRVPDQQMLEAAKLHLRDFAVVGLTERFDESLLLMRAAFGWSLPFYRVRNATTDARAGISDRARELIASKNELDEHLYAFARDLLKEAIAGQSESFPIRLATFRMLNRSAQAYRSTRSKMGSDP